MSRSLLPCRVSLGAAECRSAGRRNVSRRRLLAGFWCLLMAVAPVCAHGASPGGSALLYGNDHSFWLDAPDGGVLDNESGQANGLCAVFYPDGSTWAQSTVVMYANTALKVQGQRTVDELIAYDVNQFRARAPKLEVTGLESLPTANGEATVRKFSGDEHGNFEAIAYIDAPKVFVMLVLSSRNEKQFSESYAAFAALVKSYRYLTSDVRIESPRK